MFFHFQIFNLQTLQNKSVGATMVVGEGKQLNSDVDEGKQLSDDGVQRSQLIERQWCSTKTIDSTIVVFAKDK